jgi:hypothetical protein
MLVQTARGVGLKRQITSRLSGFGGVRKRIRCGKQRQRDASHEDKKSRQNTQINEG